MNTRIVIITVTLLALLAGTLSSLTGCNTWRGAGKDVEKAGESMQKK